MPPYTDNTGRKLANAPKSWPFGTVTPEHQRRAESAAAFARFREAQRAYIIKYRAAFGANPESVKW